MDRTMLSPTAPRAARAVTLRAALLTGLLALALAGGLHALGAHAALVQGRELAGEEAGGLFGFSVAISADGNTALVGARHSDAAGDGAWVFVHTGSTWSEQAALKVSGEEGEACEAGEQECGFGRSVALSADGNTALIGAAAAAEHRGMAWVFTRTGSSWSQTPATLTAAEESAKGHFGTAVALSADGSTALIGGPADHSHRGSAWVFTRGGAGWSESAKLFGAGSGEGAYYGRSVAISADGASLLIGAPGDVHNTGSAWAYGGSGSSWAQRGAKLTGAGEGGEGRFGFSVALSGDGATALVGARADEAGAGAAWVFARQPGSGYLQQGAKLAGAEEAGAGQLGYSAALSASGDTALLGGPRDGESAGAAWVFARSGSEWTQQGAKLTGAGASGKAWFGASVALAADARTALIGGFRDDAGTGAAWVFRDNSPLPGEEPSGEPPASGQPGGPPGPGGPSGPGAPPSRPSEPTTQTVTLLGSSGVLGSTVVSLPAPTLAANGNLTRLSGRVRVKLPRTNSFVTLTGSMQVPFATIVDARHGKVSLRTARRRGGAQTAIFHTGMFRIAQQRSGLVTATLVGGNFRVCPTAAERRRLAPTSAARSSRRHVVRTLWAEGRGSHATKGSYAAAAVLKARWLIEDRCEGTLIRVFSGRASVRNLLTHGHRTVRARHSYLARVPG
jgi:FG-GAP repeat protein